MATANEALRADQEMHPVDTDERLVCTLYEGDYHFGLAALVNSLVQNGFQGRIAVGYRGALPPWLSQLKRTNEEDRYEVVAGVWMDFIRVGTALHLTYAKAEFMQQLLRSKPACKYIWYFDPDIVIRCSWSFFVQWVMNGVAVCEDVNGSVPPDHPLRHRWAQLMSVHGLSNPQPLSRYYNAGFIALPATCQGFLELWQQVMRIAASEGLDLYEFCKPDRTNPFSRADQDPLNIALMYSDWPLTTMGADAMGFIHGGSTMYHAIGSPKPWRKNMIWSALKGNPPSGPDKAYLANAIDPIRLYSGCGLLRRRLSCAVGALIGRFYRRH